MRLWALSVCALPAVIYDAAASPDSDKSAQHVAREMEDVYQWFRELQTLAYSKRLFFAPDHEQEITRLFIRLGQNARELHGANHNLQADPTYHLDIERLIARIDDAGARFSEGRKEYALWRLRAIEQDCINCHTKYQRSGQFFAQEPTGRANMSAIDLGEYFLAARYFDKAEEHLLQAAMQEESFTKDRALNSLLVLYVRSLSDPKRAELKLTELLQHSRLSPDQSRKVVTWLDGLRNWGSGDRGGSDPLPLAEELVENGEEIDNPPGATYEGDVEFLRATALLHEFLAEAGNRQSDKGKKAICLLGRAYSHLELFFGSALPGDYLEYCIEAKPHSREAKKAFENLESLVRLGFTGSSGESLPPDVKRRLARLRETAL